MGDQCKADHNGSSCALVGMVICGRAARACDVCGKERARWYCAADSAYLCERCDGSVHTANAVAGRHERVRLGPNGAPAVKVAQTPPVHPNPRKKPRSIRRHKPSCFTASKHGISLIERSNDVNNNCNSSLIYVPNHSIMINNPRINDFDFFADSSIDWNSKFSVKAEPYSPIHIGDQVRVPDHTDDDPLFESLFDFRDLQDNDLFPHQVPIYNPLHNQYHSPSPVNTKPFADNEEIKPPVISIPYEEGREELALSKIPSPRATHPPELSRAEVNSDSLCLAGDVVDNDVAKCDEPDDRSTDSGNYGPCDLDQLDFDSMLHEHDEGGDDNDDESALHAHANSHDYMDSSNCHVTEDDSYSYAEGPCAYHGDAMEDDEIGENYAVPCAGYGDGMLDCDNTTGNESPRAWLYRVKMESASDQLDDFLQVNTLHADHDQKLICQGASQSGAVKLGLKLDFEDVLHAWADRGTFWTDGHPPPHLDSCLDFLGGWLVLDMSSTNTYNTEGDHQQMVPVLNHKSMMRGDGSAREASVLRYREKRRNRLFSKKIRYQVRKLNAEKRPRIKGRFVKRISIMALA